MSEVFVRLRRALADDRETLVKHLQKLEGLRVNASSDEATCALAALTFHHTYTALENIFKRIAIVFEGVPVGEHWHRELLDRMFEETEIRPAVLSGVVRGGLTELLAFRHYLIHGSVVAPPVGQRLSSLRDTVVDIAKMLEADINRFDDYLRELIDEPSQA